MRPVVTNPRKRSAFRRRIIQLGVALGVFAGVGAGVGAYTFWYAQGFSYLTNDPNACANCHVMREHLDAWVKGSHHQVATCNDCHAPHDMVGKYAIKAINGFNHSLAFTTGRFHEPIGITPMNRGVTEGACRYCHGDIVESIEPLDAHAPGQEMSCIRCHDSVGHNVR